jgi:hypothetical protein
MSRWRARPARPGPTGAAVEKAAEFKVQATRLMAIRRPRGGTPIFLLHRRHRTVFGRFPCRLGRFKPLHRHSLLRSSFGSMVVPVALKPQPAARGPRPSRATARQRG